MKYLDFRKQFFQKMPLFRKIDLQRSDIPVFDYQLTLWTKKHYLKKLRNGHYMFADLPVEAEVIANFLYQPSYISMETALFYYGILTDVPFTLTSVSTKKSATFHNEFGNFHYYKIKKSAFTGYTIVKSNNFNYKIATLEKALADYLYLKSKNIINAKIFFEESRFTADILKKELKWAKLKRYVKMFQNRKLTKNFSEFQKFLSKNRC